MAQRAMAKFGAALAPGDDFIAVDELGDFVDDLLFTGEVVIGDFAVVEDRFHFLGRSGPNSEIASAERGRIGR